MPGRAALAAIPASAAAVQPARSACLPMLPPITWSTARAAVTEPLQAFTDWMAAHELVKRMLRANLHQRQYMEQVHPQDGGTTRWAAQYQLCQPLLLVVPVDGTCPAGRSRRQAMPSLC